jgi:hypothetical protein
MGKLSSLLDSEVADVHVEYVKFCLHVGQANGNRVKEHIGHKDTGHYINFWDL